MKMNMLSVILCKLERSFRPPLLNILGLSAKNDISTHHGWKLMSSFAPPEERVRLCDFVMVFFAIIAIPFDEPGEKVIASHVASMFTWPGVRSIVDLCHLSIQPA